MQRLCLVRYVTLVYAEVMPSVLQWHMQRLYLMCYVTLVYAEVMPSALCYISICRGYA